MSAVQPAAYLSEPAFARAPQELAPFLGISCETPRWLPRLLRAFPSAGLDRHTNVMHTALSRQAFSRLRTSIQCANVLMC